MSVIVKYFKQATAVAGTISFNTDDLRGQVHRIFVKPATSSTSYDIEITDDNSLPVYSQKGIIGNLNDISIQLFKGIYTVVISNISANELFKFQVEFEEKFS